MERRPTVDEIARMYGIEFGRKRTDKQIASAYADWERKQKEAAAALIPKPPKPAYVKKQRMPFVYDVRKGKRPDLPKKDYDPLFDF